MKEVMPSVDTLDPKAIARKHGVSLEYIENQLQVGTRVEQEHTMDPDMAREIALDHLLELPDYYTRLEKMEESDIQEILHRSGIKAEGKMTVKPLDKFESKITDIALRLVKDEEYDPQSAGMDILDAVNDKMMTESWSRRAGNPTLYDPMARALEILQETLDEDAFQDMQARMAAQADAYLKGRDSSLAGATTSAGASEQPEPKERVSLFGTVADQLEEIRRLAIRDNYQLGREGISKLGDIIKTLQDQEQKVIDQGQGKFKRKGKGRNKGARRRWGIFSSIGESNRAAKVHALIEMCGECAVEMGMDDTDANGLPDDIDQGMQEFRHIMGDFHDMEDYLRENGMADVAEQIEKYLVQLWDWYDKARTKVAQDYSEDIQEIRRLAGITEDDGSHVLRTVVPELRGIAQNFVQDPNAKQRILEIAKELSSL